ncbi:MAG: TniQ family protein, partial [Acidimicrobiales bacterium]
MRPLGHWPLHLAPIDGEALSSWLRRLAASYQMSVAELIEHGLGQDQMAVRALDIDPSAALLDVLAERTGIDPARLRQMSLAGWTPGLLDSLEAHAGSFDTYVRCFSVLLPLRRRSKRSVGPWAAWIPGDRVQRACPLCGDDPARQGLLLMWQLPLSLSCPDHDCMLKPCIGSPGDYLT